MAKRLLEHFELSEDGKVELGFGRDSGGQEYLRWWFRSGGSIQIHSAYGVVLP